MDKLSPREATPSHTANRPRFLSEDFLSPHRRRALGPQREKARRTQGEGSQDSGCLGCSQWSEKVRRTRGECAQASGCLNRSGRGRHKTQAQLNPRFPGGPENWNCTQHRARSI